MTWTRISDNWIQIVDDLELSHDAELFHIRALILCNQILSDGQIKAKTIARLGVEFDDVDAILSELVDKLDWAPLDGGNYQIPWDGQEKAGVVKERQRQSGIRKERWNEKKNALNASRNGVNTPDQGNAVPNAERNAVENAPPSLPFPSRPNQGKGKGIVVPPSDSSGGPSSPSVTPEDESGASSTEGETSAPPDKNSELYGLVPRKKRE
ncbi:hypothetical protein E5720_03940 [Rhodococcus sp. PAMC28707]|uniref:hypothetical protein n=1 Tax=unclassified Rhodococcus (in: high G+C Gram-positive bacteria) TaxID=192944 RepID=UPI00109E1191|nr:MULTISPECIES: hypothetical protein [unclassified Rhodococcus (in: high G+C Gram-positive bacteria)]QCB50545.1 hypothetical protein E5769_10075 [Rhodococcus sp. PAMC28705]QCB57763.1 hypothetical protein E5720_03940 [Rhodococcus sp. PAMC28707]